MRPRPLWGRLLARGEISSVELTESVIERTAAVDDRVGAFLHSDPEDALAQAKASDRRRARNESLGPLDGIPVGIKDVIAVKGAALTLREQDSGGLHFAL